MDAEVTGLRHGPVCDVLQTGAAITSGAQGASGGVYEASLENQAAARSCAGPQRPRGVGFYPERCACRAPGFEAAAHAGRVLLPVPPFGEGLRRER